MEVSVGVEVRERESESRGRRGRRWGLLPGFELACIQAGWFCFGFRFVEIGFKELVLGRGYWGRGEPTWKEGNRAIARMIEKKRKSYLLFLT